MVVERVPETHRRTLQATHFILKYDSAPKKMNMKRHPPGVMHLGPIQASSHTYGKIEKTAFLEMSANMHSPFCPSDFSACVPLAHQ